MSCPQKSIENDFSDAAHRVSAFEEGVFPHLRLRVWSGAIAFASSIENNRKANVFCKCRDSKTLLIERIETSFVVSTLEAPRKARDLIDFKCDCPWARSPLSKRADFDPPVSVFVHQSANSN
jgi:hypothetical protein